MNANSTAAVKPAACKMNVFAKPCAKPCASAAPVSFVSDATAPSAKSLRVGDTFKLGGSGRGYENVLYPM